MTGSDRRLEALVLRIRIVLALGILAFVGIAQQTSLAGGELLVRGLAVGLGLAAAAGIQQIAGRRDRQVGVIVGIVAEFFAYAIAVALFERYAPLAPAILIWPIVAAAFFVRRQHVLSLAALATAMVFEIGILRNGAQVFDLITALGWGALYVSLGSLGAVVAGTLRRSQRQASSAYASVATVSTSGTYAELAEIVFAYVERVLDLPADAPAAFVFDAGDGMLTAIGSEGIDPEARARFRLDGAGAARLSALLPSAGWIGRSALDASGLPDAFRDGAVFVAPLRDDARVVGFVVVGRDRRRGLSPDTAADLERVMTQAAVAAIRIRGTRAVETQRQAMAVLLDGRGAGDSDGEIAAWLARTVRELVPTDGMAVLQDTADAAVRALLSVGLSTEQVAPESLVVVNEARRRGVAVIIPDAASEQRLALPPFLRQGACVVVPLRGQRTYLLVQRHRRDSFTTGDLQLLVLLCDQAASLFARAGAAADVGVPPRPKAVEQRLAAVTAHVRDVQGETHAQEDRARIVDAFRLAIEGNQPQLAGSGERVAALAGALASRLDLPNEDADAIYVASLLRDVGELGIDRRILDTPGQLTPDQREIVERHPLLGETILATLAFLSPVAQIVRAHHERWDGGGYPSRLRAEDIPLGARVVAVADAFVAMTSLRPYRAALSPAEAMGAVVQARGRAFDPAVVDALVALGEAGTLPLG